MIISRTINVNYPKPAIPEKTVMIISCTINVNLPEPAIPGKTVMIISCIINVNLPKPAIPEMTVMIISRNRSFLFLFHIHEFELYINSLSTTVHDMGD